MSAPALVTGATGFVGRVLVTQLLERGRDVRVLARDPGSARTSLPAGVEVIAGDLQRPLDPGLCAGIETVFHLAGHAHAEDEGSGRSDALHQSITVEGTRRLLTDAERHGVRRFLFMSSVKAIGEGTRGDHPERGDDPAPSTAYGRAKREAERAVLEGPIAGTALRSPLVYGPGVKGNLDKMMGAIARRRFPPLPEVSQRRSMVDVRDVARALTFLEETPASAGRALLVTDGEAYTTRRIFVAMSAALGVPVPHFTVPYAALRTAAVFGDVGARLLRRKLPLDSDRLDKLFGSAWYDSQPLLDLGFQPSWTLETALPEMVRAMQEQPRA